MQAKRFYRSSQNKKICGVCGGIGEDFWSRPYTDSYFDTCYVYFGSFMEQFCCHCIFYSGALCSFGQRQ